ncbi:hypothetical protein GIB67_032072 [Kingdonia uniflora]|uniref:RING-type domain-containing protein n=1 Tax=Kingdonia uniflora TaxID=39325 RepID=A0A7J7MWI8_9MAGN|nr:hypothetical protein GIB67_032072 [Kingdonia uniflora]
MPILCELHNLFYQEKDGCLTWKKPSPHSKKSTDNGNLDDIKSARRGRKEKNLSVWLKLWLKLLKEFSCLIYWKVMTLPLTIPCAHNFCKSCLEDAFKRQTFVRERICHGSRPPLRTQKNVMKCPSCPTDISDFLQNPQVRTFILFVNMVIPHYSSCY